jgi:hypothetical protein
VKKEKKTPQCDWCGRQRDFIGNPCRGACAALKANHDALMSRISEEKKR